MRVFDFFSGCGGTSWGFQAAGMEVVLGLDIDPEASATFRTNFPKAAFIEADIRELPAEVLVPYMRQGRGPVLFSGCAPCQPFSKQNRLSKIIDPRRSLLAEFGRFVNKWRPDYVFIENVPGLQRVGDDDGPLSLFKSLLDSLKYRYACEVMPASGFGVPQTRERLILLACKHKDIALPTASHGRHGKPLSTVRDWIGTLPPIVAGETHPVDPDHQAAKLSPINLARIAATREGGGRETWPKKLWLDCHKGHPGHSDVYGRLAWDKPASGLTTRCISYSNGRFGHPTQDRAISVREAACLQTFPRSYKFVGSMISKARQIGNAVPPLMAKRIGKEIMLHHKKRIA